MPSSGLFPFSFRECGSRVTRIVIVEQLPPRSLGGCGGIGSDPYRLAGGDQRADIRRQFFQVTTLGDKCAPLVAPGSVTGERTPPRNRAKLVAKRCPAT